MEGEREGGGGGGGSELWVQVEREGGRRDHGQRVDEILEERRRSRKCGVGAKGQDCARSDYRKLALFEAYARVTVGHLLRAYLGRHVTNEF